MHQKFYAGFDLHVVWFHELKSRFKRLLLVGRCNMLLPVNPFHATNLFQYTLKTVKQGFCGVFRGYMTWNRLIIIVICFFFPFYWESTDNKPHKNSSLSFLTNLIFSKNSKYIITTPPLLFRSTSFHKPVNFPFPLSWSNTPRLSVKLLMKLRPFPFEIFFKQ